ncbi:ABC transporter substrate-binding protein [Mycobacterium sp. SMC-4]|uniref:ABC transporter substrate-binding protein n=1 Tax=Mycobacterium sp. SMC-4 TaxID=2857059 RepID=UPI0021B470AA|nr:ABC transporter substrate-binding protein [Mycobacterium sp. SMC-4]
MRVGLGTPVAPFVRGEGGLDVELMAALGDRLDEPIDFRPGGGDLDQMLDELLDGTYDCVSGVVVTDARAQRVALLPPYLITGQALAVHTGRLPQVQSVDELRGLTIGAGRGDPAAAVAVDLVDRGKAGRVHLSEPGAVLADLDSGRCDAVVGLAPVLGALLVTAPQVEVVQRGLAAQPIAIAVAPSDHALLARLQVASAELEDDGTMQALRRRWLGNPYTDQSAAVL